MNAISRRFRAVLARLSGDQAGAVFPLVAFGIVVLVAFAGIATDTARGYLLKSRLSQALDSAALAGGKAFYDANRDADIQKFFAANMPSNFMGATITGPHIDTHTTNGNDYVDLTASATVPTTFMRVVGRNSMTVSAATEVTRSTSYLDLVIAIDLSTSMNESAGATSKIEAAKTAATTLVNILFGSSATKDLLKIGLVPWTAKVNVTNNGVAYTGYTQATVTSFKNPDTGSNQTKIYTANNSPVPLLAAPPSGWKGCVYARYKTSTNNGDTVLGEPSGTWGIWKGYTPIGAEGEPQSSGYCSAGSSHGDCTPCFNRGITKLTNTKATITSAINQLSVLSAETFSYTDIPQGLFWAWHVLTPEAPFSEADANPQGTRIQAIILLTDGANTQAPGDAYRNALSSSSLNTRATTLGTNIKTAGIKIYAIQFGDAPSNTQINLMKGIASDPDSDFYFYAPDGDKLNSVFTEVANKLSKLSLTK